MRFDVEVDKEFVLLDSPQKEGWQHRLTWAGTLSWLQGEALCSKLLSTIGCFCH